MYLPLLHVPLLIIPPQPLDRSIRVAEAVSLADLPATIVSIAGFQQAPFLGASLERFWTASSSDAQPSPAFAGTRSVALFRDGWHYIRTKNGEELYHLGSDREELNNLATVKAPPEVLNSLRREVDSVLAASRYPPGEMEAELADHE